MNGLVPTLFNFFGISIPALRMAGGLVDTISTRDKFLDHRLEPAKHEWARMEANDSLECRNCHAAIAMDFAKQTNVRLRSTRNI